MKGARKFIKGGKTVRLHAPAPAPAGQHTSTARPSLSRSRQPQRQRGLGHASTSMRGATIVASTAGNPRSTTGSRSEDDLVQRAIAALKDGAAMDAQWTTASKDLGSRYADVALAERALALYQLGLNLVNQAQASSMTGSVWGDSLRVVAGLLPCGVSCALRGSEGPGLGYCSIEWRCDSLVDNRAAAPSGDDAGRICDSQRVMWSQSTGVGA